METGDQFTVPRPPAQEGSFTFILLSILLFLLFFRPADLFPPMKVLHLPMLFVLICIASQVISSGSRGVPIFRLTPVTRSLLYLSLWGLICVPFAYWQGGALSTYINDWMKMMVLFLLLANVIFTVRQLRIAIWICVLSAAFVSLTAISDYIIRGTLVDGRLTALVNGPYAGANYFSVTIVLMLPYLMFDVFLHPKFLVRAVSLICCAIMMIANLMTQSRAGIAGMVLVVIAVLWYLRRWGKNVARILFITAMITPVAALLSPKGIWVRFSTIFEDYDVQNLDPTSGLRMAAGSQKERLQLLVKAISLTMEHPIFGVGMGDFSSASAHQWNTGSGHDWVQTHNTYFQYSSELGIPGLILYVLLLRVTFKTLRLARDQIPDGGPGTDAFILRLICDGTQVSLIGYLLTSAFANVGYQPYYFMVAGLSQAVSLIALKLGAKQTVEVAAEAPAWPESILVRPVSQQ
jgi:O-antigen ligase